MSLVLSFLAGAAGALVVLHAHREGFEKGIDAAIISMEPYDPDEVKESMARHPAGKQQVQQPLHLVRGEEGDGA